MAETTLYCTAETGGLSANKNNGDFDGALSGAGSESWSDNQWRHTVGNFWHSNNRANINYMIVEFDLSSIPGGDVVSAVDFDMYGQQDQASTDFDIYIAEFTPASPWDASDWQTGTDLAALTDLASINTSTFTTSGYNTFNSAALTTAVNNAVGGTIAFILWSSRTESSTWPGSSNTYESVNFYSYGQSGTSQDPRLVVTHAAGSSDTVIDSAVEALTITEQQASVALDVAVTASVEALTINTLQASVSQDAVIAGQTEALTVTGLQANIVVDAVVTGNTEQLTITSLPAEISVDSSIATNVEQLTINTLSAQILTDGVIGAVTEELTITPQQASIGFAVEVGAGVEALTITPLPASIGLDAVVSANMEALTITGLQASISLDNAIGANTEALSITTYQAEIANVGTVEAATEELTLTTLAAGVVFDATINAAAEALSITTFQALVTNPNQDTVIEASTTQLTFTMQTAGVFADVIVVFPREHQGTAAVQANTHKARVDKIPPHTTVVVKDINKYSGVL